MSGSTTSTLSTSRPLDDVMMAMDVVDTIRRSTVTVEKELNADQRDQQLLERLKNIYGTQGIEVSDDVLREGITALREDRFRYTPTPPSFSRKLAEIYVRREKWFRPVKTFFWIICFTGVGYGAFTGASHFVDNLQKDRALHVEQKQKATLHEIETSITDLRNRLNDLTNKTDIKDRADRYFNDATYAIKNNDVEPATLAKDKLASLVSDVQSQYQLRIVNGVNNTSGVWRIPDGNPNARNYYLIVEAINEDGQNIAISVTNEETNTTVKTSTFGVRVSPSVFQDIMRDKQDDGIIQNNMIGIKKRGNLKPSYNISVMDGIITQW